MKKTVLSLLLVFVLMFALAVPAFALDDRTYPVDYKISTETGIQKCLIPAALRVKDGKNYVALVFNDSEVDKLYLGDEEILPIGSIDAPYKNFTGNFNVFDLPLEAFGEDITFVLHTRGNNLVTDEYIINVAEYDESFDADAQYAAVKADNLGAQESRFYDWHTGMSVSLWGPFVFLGFVAIAIFVVGKKIDG